MSFDNTSNTTKILCDLCEKNINVQNIIKNGNYWHCNSCYNWLTAVPKPETKAICSNCEINPVGEKHLCGFTDWCEFCDVSLWSMRDNDKSYERE